jgi:hypothetical protein
MTPVISSAPTKARDTTPARDTSGDDQAKDRFAGMLAHAHAKHVHKPAPKHAGGTSELDATDASKDDKETTGASDPASADAKPAAGTNPTATATAPTPTAPTATAPTATNAAAIAAASAAAAAAPNAAAAMGVVRSVTALNPELQAKLARVIDRMQTETGHTVTIEETYRSQARQNALYAQGRDAAGPVVTWTENSKHTQGRAVDLLLDGGAAGPDAYATLQRIAKEEGLQTLGARDPGHLELPGSGAANANFLQPVAPADASGPGQVSVSRLAQVAPVAQVAQVTVARPAPVAQVASVAPVANPAQPGAAGANASVGAIGAQFKQTKDGSDKSGTDGSGSSGSNAHGGQHNGYGVLSSSFTLDHAGSVGAAAPVVGSTAAERTERILAASDKAPVRPLSQITMNVDAGNGATDKIQVSLRGNALNTTIDVADARAAQTMTSRSDELVRALNRDGMEVESMRVRAVANTAAPIAAPTAQNTTDSSTSSRFERGSQWQQQRDQSQNDRRQQRDQRKENAQ